MPRRKFQEWQEEMSALQLARARAAMRGKTASGWRGILEEWIVCERPLPTPKADDHRAVMQVVAQLKQRHDDRIAVEEFCKSMKHKGKRK